MIHQDKIIEAIVAGRNDKVFDELYNTVFPSIRKFIKSKNGTTQQAEDCFQDAIVSLILAVRNEKFKKEYSISNYLFAAARNRWFTQIRTTLTHETQIGDRDFELVEKNPLLEKEKFKTIQKLLDSIGEQCKELMTLVLFEKKRLAEVKEIMGFSSEEVVKTYNYRCKKKLKELIKNDEEAKAVLRN